MSSRSHAYAHVGTLDYDSSRHERTPTHTPQFPNSLSLARYLAPRSRLTLLEHLRRAGPPPPVAKQQPYIQTIYLKDCPLAGR